MRGGRGGRLYDAVAVTVSCSGYHKSKVGSGVNYKWGMVDLVEYAGSNANPSSLYKAIGLTLWINIRAEPESVRWRS